jgi:hypothetical protein
MTDLDRAGVMSGADEAAVEDVLRGVFREQDSNPEPNSFQRIFGNARRQAAERAEQKNGNTRRRPISWNLAYGLLAVAVVVVLLQPWNTNEPNEAEAQTRQLVADLSRSSRWISPSDGLLKTQRAGVGSGVGSGVGELPDFSGMKFTMQETLQWPDIET